MLATNAESRSEDAMRHPFSALAHQHVIPTATGSCLKVVTSLVPIAQKQTRRAP
jgi:hypothetical protein